MTTYNKFAQIIISGLENKLTYAIPERLKEVDVGYEVNIELKNRIERGWVIEVTDTLPTFDKTISDLNGSNSNQIQLFKDPIESRIKIKEVLSGHRAFLPGDLSFFKFISDYYSSDLYEVLENAVPKKIDERISYDLTLAKKYFDKPFEELETKLAKSAPAQKAALKIIHTNSGSISNTEFEDLAPETKRALTSLIKKGFIEKVVANKLNTFSKVSAPDLTTQQKIAIDKIIQGIQSQSFSPFLLFGITGSGKTEIYIKSIEAAIKNGGSALIIVPEIALTPQLLSRFNARLSQNVAVLHSQIGSGAKWSEWTSILNNQKKIIIGARSAIFAPIEDLKIIIVDEEHESSYKQAEGLRYNARDLALIKGRDKKCPVILGSATPSFESLANATKNQLQLLELTERATQAKLPEIKVVDLTSLPKSAYVSPNITRSLYDEMNKTLEKGEQIILFYNKRGFASFLQCTHCGKALECPQCSVTMTFYQGKNKVSCHYCGATKAAPPKCPYCSDTSTHEIDPEVASKRHGKLVPRGSGTEKVYDEVLELFPEISVDRMDRDVVGQKGSIENILSKMQSGETRILIGTQMLAKGHDLPSVTLVGIIDADVGLHFPDFRSSERTFQLIVQASGRAGRGTLPGSVIIQTREPNHPTIVAAITNRFKAFARYELDFRKKLEYPPENRLARIVVSSPNKQEAAEASNNLITFLNNLLDHEKKDEETAVPSWKALGPSPAPIEKLRSRYRWHLLIKCGSARKLSQIAREIKAWKDKTKYTMDLRVIVDIDPVDMM